MLATAPFTALVFLPFVAPIAIWVAWSDMKFMKIPNKAVLALAAIFLVVGPFALPLDEWAWRWVHLLAFLGIGIIANAAGLVGAGDAKFAAAMAPFFALPDTEFAMALFAACVLAAFASHRVLRAVGPVRAATPDWASWTHAKFPMGLALAGTLLFYLAAAVWFA